MPRTAPEVREHLLILAARAAARISVARRQEIARLKAVNERDRSAIAAGLDTIEKALRAREWLRLGRGSYEWDDDRWKDEFGAAYDEILAALEPLRQIGGDHTDCPVSQAAIQATRAEMSANCEGKDDV